MGLNGTNSRKSLVRSGNQIFLKALNQIGIYGGFPLKMMYNISMLRHRFSNERGGGGVRALNHLPSVKCVDK